MISKSGSGLKVYLAKNNTRNLFLQEEISGFLKNDVAIPFRSCIHKRVSRHRSLVNAAAVILSIISVDGGAKREYSSIVERKGIFLAFGMDWPINGALDGFHALVNWTFKEKWIQ